MSLRLLEEIAHDRGRTIRSEGEHLQAARREETQLRLPGQGAYQKRLSGSRRTVQEDSSRRTRAQAGTECRRAERQEDGFDETLSNLL
jgi:hypothetical protein